jgi:peptidoglycan/xylan/chitin deacetylase (PgdA/CDA1 family)
MSAVLQRDAARRWRPSGLVAGSIALHAAAIVLVIVDAQAWTAALAAIGANHLLLGALGMWPRSTLLGPNIVRLPAAARARREIALTFDDGPDPDVTPLVLDLLDRFDAKATFFCIAREASRHPDLCREIARRGHAVENHSCGHLPTFAFLGLRGIRRELASAQATLAEIAGRAPRFFRPPAGLRNPLLDPVLHALGLRLVSWTRRGFDTRKCHAQRVATRLLDNLDAGDILLLHDGHCARSSTGMPVVLEVLPQVLEAARARGLRPVGLDKAIEP